ncbi:MAG: hypothetical protein IKL00_04095, partial [Oscillospiraceae bacterium]|nr:hypothetical protein [Oscillospiraceae bacterium]
VFKKYRSHKGQYLGAVVAGRIMMTGYLLFEAVFMGYGMGAVAAIPGNLVQGFTGCTAGVFFSYLMEKNTYLRRMLHKKES